MNKSKGSSLVVLLVFIGVLVAGLVVTVGSYVSATNTAVRYEANIEKFHTNSKNVLSSYTLKVKEMAQVPDMFKKDLQDVIEKTFQGRYGKDGSKAVFQFIKENNMQLDSKLYSQLQATMEAGRNEFKLAQSKKLDVCANYEMERNYVWSGFWMQTAGFPKKDVDKLCTVVIDSVTNGTFESGEATIIKLK